MGGLGSTVASTRILFVGQRSEMFSIFPLPSGNRGETAFSRRGAHPHTIEQLLRGLLLRGQRYRQQTDVSGSLRFTRNRSLLTATRDIDEQFVGERFCSAFGNIGKTGR